MGQTTTQRVRELIRVIKAYQKANRLTDLEVATKLGVSRSTWNNARLGLFQPGLPFAQKAAACPEFRAEAEAVLMPALDSVGDTAAAS